MRGGPPARIGAAGGPVRCVIPEARTFGEGPRRAERPQASPPVSPALPIPPWQARGRLAIAA